jgi:hypothetical protein
LFPEFRWRFTPGFRTLRARLRIDGQTFSKPAIQRFRENT